MREVIKALEVYQVLSKLITGKTSDKVSSFIEKIKPFEGKQIESLQIQLIEEIKVEKTNKTVKVDVIGLGKDYYEMHKENNYTQEVSDFIELDENTKLKEILHKDLKEVYSLLEAWDIKNITINQLNFLGYALLNSELRGRTKKDRKKNLLQLIWKVIETERMNEIYENNLL